MDVKLYQNALDQWGSDYGEKAERASSRAPSGSSSGVTEQPTHNLTPFVSQRRPNGSEAVSAVTPEPSANMLTLSCEQELTLSCEQELTLSCEHELTLSCEHELTA
jgi:hypothetical protein